MYYEYYQVQPLIGGVADRGLLSVAPQDWRWRLKADNHKVIASGQGYSDKQDCLHAIELMKATTLATLVKLVSA
ncbi:MAG: YegP family protein [Ramlibacter sp.]|nr:YegP family protein [Ramlibacter sp.]